MLLFPGLRENQQAVKAYPLLGLGQEMSPQKQRTETAIGFWYN